MGRAQSYGAAAGRGSGPCCALHSHPNPNTSALLPPVVMLPPAQHRLPTLRPAVPCCGMAEGAEGSSPGPRGQHVTGVVVGGGLLGVCLLWAVVCEPLPREAHGRRVLRSLPALGSPPLPSTEGEGGAVTGPPGPTQPPGAVGPHPGPSLPHRPPRVRPASCLRMLPGAAHCPMAAHSTRL